MYVEHEEKNDRTDGHKLLLDALRFIGISECDIIPYYRGILQLGPE
jgi:hypothetical protein